MQQQFLNDKLLNQIIKNKFDEVKLLLESGVKINDKMFKMNEYSPLVNIVHYITFCCSFTTSKQSLTYYETLISRYERHFYKMVALLLYHGLDVYGPMNEKYPMSQNIVDFIRANPKFKIINALVSNKIRTMFFTVIYRAKYVYTKTKPVLYNIINGFDIETNGTVIINKQCKIHILFNDTNLVLYISKFL